MKSETNWPRLLIVESASEDLPLQKLSPFAVQKGFQAIAGTPKSIKRLRDGSFLVECGKRAQAQNLLRTNRFIDRPVKVSIHKALNPSRGVIRCRDLADMLEVEIRDELKDQGVAGVNRVTLKKEGKVIPTNTLFLTFGSPELPKEITVGQGLFRTLCVASDRLKKAEQNLVLLNQFSALSDDEMDLSHISPD